MKIPSFAFNQNSDQEYPYRLARISKPSDLDLEKQWQVDYGVWSLKNQKVIRKRIALTGNTAKDRLEKGREQMTEINKLLRRGAYLNDVKGNENPKTRQDDPLPEKAKKVHPILSGPPSAPSQEDYPYRLAFISKPNDNSLQKQWMVEYGAWSLKKQKLVRKRISLTQKTASERIETGREYVKAINKLLRKGAFLDDINRNNRSSQLVTKHQVEKMERVKPILVVSPKTTMFEAIQEFLNYKQKTVKYNSFRTYRTHLRVLLKYLIELGLKKLQFRHFSEGHALNFTDQIILSYGLSNRSHNAVKDTAKMFFGHWITRINKAEGKVIMFNPFDDIKDKQSISNKHTPYSLEQRQAFKECCIEQNEPYLLLFVSFIYYTFLRPRIELRLLRIADLGNRTIVVNAEQAKNNRTGFVEIPPALEQLIAEYKLREYPENYYVFGRDGVPGKESVGPDYYWRKHRKILKSMKLLSQKGKAYDMYSWKHTGVIALWEATQNIRLIQNHCRHSTAQQTEEYLRDLGLIVRQTQIEEFPAF